MKLSSIVKILKEAVEIPETKFIGNIPSTSKKVIEGFDNDKPEEIFYYFDYNSGSKEVNKILSLFLRTFGKPAVRKYSTFFINYLANEKGIRFDSAKSSKLFKMFVFYSYLVGNIYSNGSSNIKDIFSKFFGNDARANVFFKTGISDFTSGVYFEGEECTFTFRYVTDDKLMSSVVTSRDSSMVRSGSLTSQEKETDTIVEPNKNIDSSAKTQDIRPKPTIAEPNKNIDAYAKTRDIRPKPNNR